MTMGNEALLDLAARTGLDAARGSRYWRCLEELADTPAFRELMQREFPSHAAEWTGSVTRRQFLTFLGASLALAGLSGCGKPPAEKIVPYVREPEGVVPGKPLFYATAMTLGGGATGLLVEQHLGRPTKIEGNPDHPASLGATDAFAQAAILDLYDPDRSAAVTHLGQISSWAAAVSALQAALERQRPQKGAGLRVLTEPVTSPALARQLERVLEAFPSAKWHQYEPVARDNVHAGTHRAFGEMLDVVYRLEEADVILALDADFLGSGAGHLRYARDFAARRRVWPATPAEARMNRLYVVETTPSRTGAVADHRRPMRAEAIESFARAVAVRLGVEGAQPPRFPVNADLDKWLDALVHDLRTHRGRGLVVAGAYQPPAVHALAHALNAALGNAGRTVVTIPPVQARPGDGMASLRELMHDMNQGRVEMLVVLGGNPAFNASADLGFADALTALSKTKTAFTAHLGLYRDETARLCQWHVPEAHFLESWGDARAYDGTASIVQPLIAPLYHGVSAHQMLAVLQGRPPASAHDLVREFWREYHRERGAADTFEQFWEKALHDGVVEGTAFSPRAATLRENWWQDRVREETKLAPSASEGSSLEIVFRPDPTIHDGRFANNGWLQELPKPLTKLTWDAVALVSPRTAKEHGLAHAIGADGGSVQTDLVELEYQGRKLEAPVWIVPGHAEGAVTVTFGYGRTQAGRVGSKIGFNGYALRTSGRPWFDNGLVLRKTGQRHTLACTQLHHVMHGRDLVRSATLEQYQKDPHVVGEARHGPKPHADGRQPLPMVSEPAATKLYPEYEYPRYKWGMVIDQSVCIGCQACVIACQAENNIPVVGKEEVARGREMHWLRVDHYYAGEAADNPTNTYFQPVPCMHCEKAPCELVCPVNATVHSDEGLNDMVYNRCVGTRYCSNNCPYKVRRFNYFEYADWSTESHKPLRNPDVTVRSRGVMEKCTYCVQRINQARIHAEKDHRPKVRNRAGVWIKPIYENELLTACQATCPTGAIVFGDLNDPTSQVGKMRDAGPLHYGLLAELGTQPRTTYLAALRNPNSELT